MPTFSPVEIRVASRWCLPKSNNGEDFSALNLAPWLTSPIVLEEDGHRERVTASEKIFGHRRALCITALLILGETINHFRNCEGHMLCNLIEVAAHGEALPNRWDLTSCNIAMNLISANPTKGHTSINIRSDFLWSCFCSTLQMIRHWWWNLWKWTSNSSRSCYTPSHWPLPGTTYPVPFVMVLDVWVISNIEQVNNKKTGQSRTERESLEMSATVAGQKIIFCCHLSIQLKVPPCYIDMTFPAAILL